MSETRSVEMTGPDIEEAIEAGLKQLQVSRESVIVEILEEPTRGILGLGSKSARVRLTTAARPFSERAAVVDEDYDYDEDEDEDDYDDEDDFEDEDDYDDEDDFDEDDIPRRRSSSGRRASSYAMPEVTTIAEADLTEEMRIGRRVLEEVLKRMGTNAEVIVEQMNYDSDEEPVFILHIQGQDLSTLIGRRGNTLSSLQYITRLITSRELQRRADFTVDVDGYKAKRLNRLHRLANQMADRAIEREQVMKLKPMPAHERRIIHMALRGRADVSTRSEGEGRYRRVTIIPE
jgi:spoIIIJ-associated protein